VPLPPVPGYLDGMTRTYGASGNLTLDSTVQSGTMLLVAIAQTSGAFQSTGHDVPAGTLLASQQVNATGTGHNARHSLYWLVADSAMVSAGVLPFTVVSSESTAIKGRITAWAFSGGTVTDFLRAGPADNTNPRTVDLAGATVTVGQTTAGDASLAQEPTIDPDRPPVFSTGTNVNRFPSHVLWQAGPVDVVSGTNRASAWHVEID
jgi:hypothetical protein